jgi:hypothetical protein
LTGTNAIYKTIQEVLQGSLEMVGRSKRSKGAAAHKLHLADARQCALLLLRLFELRNKTRKARGVKPMTRAKLTAPMLKTLWNRQRLASDFLQEVADWLLMAGWVFFFAGPVYAAVQVSAVQNWPRVSTAPINEDLKDIAEGEFVFDALERLLWNPEGEISAGGDENSDSTRVEDDE